MRIRTYSSAALLALGLAACNPIAEYTESESPKHIVLDGSTVQIGLRFLAGSSVLGSTEVAQLRGLASTGQIAPSDRVLVAAGGSPPLAQLRVGTISAELLRYGVIASRIQIASVPPNGAVVEVVRHEVTLPPCPNWSKWPAGAGDFTNTPHSNFGCANVTNLGRMVASPTDLASGRPLGPTAAQPAAAAVSRYLNDKITPPTAAIAGVSGSGASSGGGTGGAAPSQ
jgi:type IV pilus biogenesis protein CpaD/CtpE